VPLAYGKVVLRFVEQADSTPVSHLKDALPLHQHPDFASTKTRELVSSPPSMAFPTQHEVEVPLLRVINELGGQAAPKSIYPKVAAHFPQLSEEDLSAKLPSSPSTFKWHNLVQWSRQALVDREELDGSTRGVWKITAKGKQRLESSQGLKQQSLEKLVGPSTLKDLIYQNESEVKSRILSELKGLTSKEFEMFCQRFLRLLGYQELIVKQPKGGADGGIDGHGMFKQGVVSIRSAFQAKRWSKNPVGRPEIDKFRGAIQGDYDHGVFLTTARFTNDAELASIKKGAISLLLLDGEAIAETMVRSGIGVTRRPVHLLDIEPEFFRFDVDDELL
jgi:restriction system protein